MPHHDDFPFSALEGADEMKEAIVSDIFMSNLRLPQYSLLRPTFGTWTTAQTNVVNTEQLAPGLTF